MSVKNPNTVSKNRRAARAATARKHKAKQIQRKTQAPVVVARGQQQEQKEYQISGADARRGARTGLLPTSGPRRALGGKQRRKLERKMGYALARKMEAEGEVVMKDASSEKTTTTKEKKQQQQQQGQQKDGASTTEEEEEETTVEMDDIS